MAEVKSGTVIHTNKGTASVRIDRADWCGTCDMKIWCHPEKDDVGTILVQNSLNAQVGQKVLISEKSEFLLKISILQYGIPLVGFLLGVILTYIVGVEIRTFPQELCLFLGGLLGLFLAGLASYLWARTIADRGEYYGEIREIIG
jgi:positive regulator of sigma E activity